MKLEWPNPELDRLRMLPPAVREPRALRDSHAVRGSLHPRAVRGSLTPHDLDRRSPVFDLIVRVPVLERLTDKKFLADAGSVAHVVDAASIRFGEFSSATRLAAVGRPSVNQMQGRKPAHSVREAWKLF